MLNANLFDLLLFRSLEPYLDIMGLIFNWFQLRHIHRALEGGN